MQQFWLSEVAGNVEVLDCAKNFISMLVERVGSTCFFEQRVPVGQLQHGFGHLFSTLVILLADANDALQCALSRRKVVDAHRYIEMLVSCQRTAIGGIRAVGNVERRKAFEAIRVRDAFQRWNRLQGTRLTVCGIDVGRVLI